MGLIQARPIVLQFCLLQSIRNERIYEVMLHCAYYDCCIYGSLQCEIIIYLDTAIKLTWFIVGYVDLFLRTWLATV